MLYWVYPVDGTNANVAVGYEAGKLITTGINNTAVGYQSLGASAAAANTGGNNACFGYRAGYDLEGSGGNSNTLVGSTAGDGMTTGGNCVFVGYATDGTADADNQIAIGNGVVTDGANKGRWGNSSIATNNIQTDWTVDSDRRIKKDIEDSDIGLSFVNALKPRKFRKRHPSEWDAEILEERYKKGGANYDDDKDEVVKDEFDEDKVWNGLIAQEVKDVMDESGKDFSGWYADTKGKQGIQYSTMVVPLIKAVQELSEKVESQQKEIEELKKK